MPGADGLPAELLTILADERDFDTMVNFYDVGIAEWRGGGMR